MTDTKFRNVDVSPSASAAHWPAEAIETAIDRGTVSDWRALAAAIRRDPWGPMARVVEEIASWDEHYGVDELMKRILASSRSAIDRRARTRYARKIKGWRSTTGLSLREFARLAGTSASRLSNYEQAKVAPTTDVLGRIEYVAGQHRRR